MVFTKGSNFGNSNTFSKLKKSRYLDLVSRFRGANVQNVANHSITGLPDGCIVIIS